ncbi:heterokaryon incompatibility protein-domain-containing protein [Nemania abortiva]|nr:heterokaryon incompatibility protein-domain-containing protein [Nemania abortiva]
MLHDRQLYYELFFRETRLVTILPGQWSDSLQCSLVPFPIDRVPKTVYKALSYVWGSPNVTEDIIVNGQNQKITVNLACAIRHLRHPEIPLKIWIDALCINQNSASEKNAQVALMRDIYAGAEEVIVFLGDGVDYRVSKAHLRRPLPLPVVFWNDSRDDVHLRLFRDSPESHYKRKTWNAFRVTCLVRILSQPGDYHYAGALIERSGVRQHQEIFELLRRLLVEPWWQRIWVVQEVAILPKVTICYGNVTAPWNMFVQAAETIKSQPHRLIGEAEYVKVLSLFTRQRFSDRKATDERDKIYALLGLAKEEGLLVPNYSVDIYTLYEETAIALIKNYYNLALFLGDLKRKNNKNLASWIPDWSAFFNKADHDRMALQGVYNACLRWYIVVFEKADEYWDYVAEQMGLLVQDLREPGRQPREFSVGLRGALRDYKDFIEREWLPDQIALLSHLNLTCELCTQILKLTQEGQFQPRMQIAEMEELFNFSPLFRGEIIGAERLRKSRTTHRSYELYPIDNWRPLPAGGNRLSEGSRPYHSGTLQIETKYKEKVKWCGTKLNTWDDVYSSLFTVCEWMREFPLRFNILWQEIRECFARTLVGGIYLRTEGIDQVREKITRL